MIEIREPYPNEAHAMQQLIGDGRFATFTDLSVGRRQSKRAQAMSEASVREREDAIRAALAGHKTRLHRVAVAEGKVVGMLASRRTHANEYHPSIPVPADVETVSELESLYVQPDFQGRGIGQRLLTAHHEWAATYPGRPSVLVVVDTNKSAIRFYEQNGYVIVGDRFRWMNDPAQVNCFLMRRESLF